MKCRRFLALLAALALLCGLGSAMAADGSQSYVFTLAANGQAALTVAPGDSFTVTLDISRTDDAGGFTMYAASYVLLFSAKLFALETDSITFDETDARGVRYQYSVDGDEARLTVSVKSEDFEGAEWSNPSELLSFRLTALAVGSSMFRSERAAMSNVFGGAYDSEANSVLVTVSTAPPAADTKPSDIGAASARFADVEAGSWYEAAVGYVVDAGLFNGTGEREFSPNQGMTRAMLMTVLARLDGVDTSGGANWYDKGMTWAVALGISDGTMPESGITREQFATMLYRYAKSKGLAIAAEELTGYSDAGEISSWAREAVTWAVGAGIITGMTETTLVPSGYSTRAQVATMLMRFDIWSKQG